MAEYIEREAALSVIRKLNTPEKSPAQKYMLRTASVYIQKIPAADVAPVVPGRWDSSGRYKFTDGSIAVRCTKCGCSLHEKEYMESVWNYCPVRGSIMDLEV